MAASEALIRVATPVVLGLLLALLVAIFTRARPAQAGWVHVTPGPLLWLMTYLFATLLLIVVAAFASFTIASGLPPPEAWPIIIGIVAALSAMTWWYLGRVTHIVRLRLRYSADRVIWTQGQRQYMKSILELESRQILGRGLIRIDFPDGAGFRIDWNASGISDLVQMAKEEREDYMLALAEEQYFNRAEGEGLSDEEEEEELEEPPEGSPTVH